MPPPALTSERYTRDYNEVKALGSFGSTDRTPEQTDLAYFWSENFVAQWNRALRCIAANYIHKTGDRARLFALANLALADALITAWDSRGSISSGVRSRRSCKGTTTATPTRPETTRGSR